MRRRFMSNVNSFDIDNYLTFKAGVNHTPLAITFSGGDIEYCIDGSGEWITLPNGSQTAFVNSGHTISFRANLTPVQNNGIGCFHTVYPVDFSLLGNCMSLLYGDNAASYDAVPDYAFRSLFYNLRVTHVSKNFLPATILGCECYYNMFRYCGVLTMAPELPATTLANACYSYMFQNCKNLNYIKMLATDISESGCLNNWVYGVASTGTFVKNSAMTTLPTGTNGIPSGWTVVDDGEESGGGQFYINYDGFGAGTLTFTIDSPKTWNECVGLKDDTGVYEITYDEVVPGVYRFMINSYKYSYAIESDEDDNTPIPEDLIKIGTTYYAHGM